MQAPREVIQKYGRVITKAGGIACADFLIIAAGKYDDGPDALTERRLERLKKLGLVADNVQHAPPVGHLGKAWKDMTAKGKQTSARNMEIFAAMVDVIDQNVGRVVDYLESTNELDNTFILFMSDNGAEGVALEAIPVGA